MNWRHLFVVACVLTAGCHPAVGLMVTELPDGRLSIKASERLDSGIWNPVRPCVHAVSIRRRDGDEWADYWNIALTDVEATCVGEFTYPLVPPGYERGVTPAPDDLLRPGDVLQVEILGPGFGAGATITVGERPGYKD